MAGAPFGNKNNSKGRMFFSELRKALTQEPERLRAIALKLISLAEKGEPWAVKELVDRIDGKPSQPQETEGTDTAKLLTIDLRFVTSEESNAPRL